MPKHSKKIFPSNYIKTPITLGSQEKKSTSVGSKIHI